MNIFNVLRKFDVVFKNVVTYITSVGITISKISMFEGRMNFKGILVKFLFTNIAIKQFILKVFNFRFFIRKLVMKKTLGKNFTQAFINDQNH